MSGLKNGSCDAYGVIPPSPQAVGSARLAAGRVREVGGQGVPYYWLADLPPTVPRTPLDSCMEGGEPGLKGGGPA